MVPLIQNGEDKGHASELPDNVFGKDTYVNPESAAEPLPLSNDKKCGTQSVKRHNRCS